MEQSREINDTRAFLEGLGEPTDEELTQIDEFVEDDLIFYSDDELDDENVELRADFDQDVA